jgi:hypothetical protein
VPAFARGALSRGAIGALFTLGAAALVAAVEAPSHALGEMPRTATVTAPGPSRSLRVDSTFPVATWTVTVGRQTLVPDHSGDDAWSGLAPAGEIVISAEPLDAGDGRLHALRLVAGDGASARESTAWGAGTVTAVVPP